MMLKCSAIQLENYSRIRIHLDLDGEDWMFDGSTPMEIDVFLPRGANQIKCLPNPSENNPYDTYSDFPEYLDPDDVDYLKTNQCNLSKFNLTKSFKLTIDANLNSTAARRFGKIICMQLRGQLEEHFKKIYVGEYAIKLPTSKVEANIKEEV